MTFQYKHQTPVARYINEKMPVEVVRVLSVQLHRDPLPLKKILSFRLK